MYSLRTYNNCCVDEQLQTRPLLISVALCVASDEKACNLLNFPPISPEVFSVSVFGVDLSLRWYSLAYLVGFILAYAIAKHFVRRDYVWRNNTAPMDPEQIGDFISTLVLGVIIGGRLGYVFFYNIEYFISNPFAIFRLWEGGMSFHGGFSGVVIALILFCKRNGVPILQAADLIAAASPPGLFFGRIANFINAELWGKPTSVAWGVVFPGEAAQTCQGVTGPCARHPSQLYEAGLEGILLLIVILICIRMGAFKKLGFVSGLFITGYGLSRYFVEFYRVPDAQFFTNDNPYGYAYEFVGLGVTMGQALSVPMILVGGVFMVTAIMKSRYR